MRRLAGPRLIAALVGEVHRSIVSCPLTRPAGTQPPAAAAKSRSGFSTFTCEWEGSLVLSSDTMTTTNNLRSYPRLSSPKGTILAWRTAGKGFVSSVDNLGLGGIYIRTPQPPPPGTFIQLLLDVPTGEVRARAVVRTSQPRQGMGVKFVAMHQEDRARFARWLKLLSS